ncbi:MAG TPA: tetratricopeptide repeat-containing sensor histidine kinase [Cyclobacteriaceae bacterium]|jgi:signal transduction histidine kinase/Tfp pilus assembly protein PilF|nr:tetratricopeptide repeat-containing sensor histidine kinase [Cyclobacteriaceae bacterium]
MNHKQTLTLWLLLTITPSAQSQTKQAIDSLQRLFASTKADTTKNIILIEIAKQYYRNKPDTTLLLTKQAASWAEENKFVRGQARAYNVMGLSCLVKGNYNEALGLFQKSIPLFTIAHDRQGLGFAHNNIGLLYYYQGDSLALGYFQKAVDIHTNIQDDEGTALALNNIGLVYEGKGDFQLALAQYQKALALYKKVEIKLGIGQSYTNLGFIYMQLKDYIRSLENLESGVRIQGEINDQTTLVSSYMGLAEVYKRLKQKPKSIEYAARALELSLQIQSAYDAMEASGFLYRAYKDQHRTDEALRYFELNKKLSDSIFSVEKTKAIASLETRVELEKKEIEVEVLKGEKRIQTIATVVALGILIAASTFTYFLFRNRRKLQQQSEMLETSNKVKDKIFSIVSHDLRSPLNALKGMFSLLEKGDMNAQEFQQFIPDLNKRLTHAADITEELLLWSRNQLNRIELNPVEVKPYQLFKKEADRFKQNAYEKGINIIIEADESIKTKVDVDTMQTVIRNLVSNAVKFCKKGDTITLVSKEDSNTIKLAVKDTGTGIKPEDLSKIFDSRGFTTHGTAGEAGTGLGLMLCKEFVEKNGGKIDVESNWGKGTSFSITLPAL